MSNLAEEKKELNAKLRKLQKKEEETVAMLEAINRSLRDLGYAVDSTPFRHQSSAAIETKSVLAKSGIRINNKLSFRGKEMSTEQLLAVDFDKDGLLNFEDFRSLKAFSSFGGIVNDHAYCHWETWKAVMADAGVDVSVVGEVDALNYIKYRDKIEPKQPLAIELHSLGVGFLQPRLKQWGDITRILRETDDYRQELIFSNKLDQESSKATEIIALDEIPYVLCNGGIIYTKPELAVLMIQRGKKAKLMENLLRKYSKLHLSEPTTRIELNENGMMSNKPFETTLADVVTMTRKNFIGWLLAIPPLEYLHTPWKLYRKAIEIKYKSIRNLRLIDSYSRKLFDFATHMNDRLLFRDFRPLAKATNDMLDISTLKMGISIGDDHKRDFGLSASWKLLKLESPDQLLKKLKLPVDSGTTIMLDIQITSDASEELVNQCAIQLKLFLAFHFEKEFRNNRQYNGIHIMSAINDFDGSRVLRIALCYKRIVSIDGFLHHLMIPYKFNDLVTVLVGEIKSNIDIASLVKQSVKSLDEDISFSMDVSIGYRRNIILSIFERLRVACAAGLTAAQATFKKIIEEEKSIKDNSSVKSKLDTKTATQKLRESLLADEQAEELRRIERWSDMSTYYPFISQLCTTVIEWLRIFKSNTFRLKFKSFGDFTHRLRLGSVWCRQIIPEELSFQPGYLKRTYEALKYAFSDEMKQRFHSLQAFLEQIKQQEENKRRYDLINAAKD
eukprot:gene13004-17434_t